MYSDSMCQEPVIRSLKMISPMARGVISPSCSRQWTIFDKEIRQQRELHSESRNHEAEADVIEQSA